MRNNLVETVMGAVVLVITGGFLYFAFSGANVGSTGGKTYFAHFDKVDVGRGAFAAAIGGSVVV